MHTQFTNTKLVSQVLGNLYRQETEEQGVYLIRLRGNPKPIGALDSKGSGTFTCSRKAEHLFRVYTGWGFIAELFERYTFRWLCLICDDIEYKTTRDVILQYGVPFTNGNNERQLVLPLEYWGIEIVKRIEGKRPEKTSQLNLFEVTQ